MAEEFTQVRRKDDPLVVLPQPLAVSALPYFPDWEPIPAAGDAENTPGPEPEPAPEEKPPTSRPRTARKATTKEGDD